MSTTRQTSEEDEGFERFVVRFGQELRKWIALRVSDRTAAEDLFQQTLMQAWLELRRGKWPRDAEAWLRTLARNRCVDFYRSRSRREQAIPDDELDLRLTRHGRVALRRRAALEDVMEAMAAIPLAEQEALRLFYLEGCSVREISERQDCPEGTVKRRLSEGRSFVRTRLGVRPVTPQEAETMKTAKDIPQGFPAKRPDISFRPLPEEPFALVTKELLWWGIVPEPGQKISRARYASPNGALDEIHHLETVRKARIHRQDCFQVQVRVWNKDRKQKPDWFIFAKLLDDDTECLATLDTDMKTNKIELYTQKDEGFDMDWGRIPRRFKDRGDVRQPREDEIEIQDLDSYPAPIASGLWSVRVGSREFTCIRLLEFPPKNLAEKGFVGGMGFLTREGHTIYNNGYVSEFHWKDYKLYENETLKINGVRYRLWDETISEWALKDE